MQKPWLTTLAACAAALTMSTSAQAATKADTKAKPAMPATFKNPVVSGFASDPSVCRKGDDYYLVTSTFEYLPGLPVYHSKDLVHWRHIGNALSRESQLTFPGRKSSKAIFAPTIRCQPDAFYIINTDVEGIGNFVISAKDPAGPWSDPVRIPEPEFGMDPSLLFDDDGTVYYTRHGGLRNGGAYQAIIDLKTGKLKEPAKEIWKGMGGVWPEGPHLYKINGWYYLMIAEGGTSYEHRITMARSRSPWGPFEPHPDNPVLTHMNRPDALFQALGHADLVSTPDGNWWATLLGIRSQRVDGKGHHHIGRETLLAPVKWRADGWPEFGQNRELPQPQPTAGLPGWHPWPAEPVRESFSAKKPLALHWSFVRTYATGQWSLTDKPGSLRLLGSKTGLESLEATPTYIGRRQTHLHQRFATEVNFSPKAEGDAAGVALRMNESHHLLLGISAADKGRQLQCVQRLADKPIVHGTAALPEGPIQLQVDATPTTYSLSWRAGGEKGGKKPGAWQALCSVPTYQLSTETSSGFTGVYMGLYAHAPSGARTPADFAWVDFEATGD